MDATAAQGCFDPLADGPEWLARLAGEAMSRAQQFAGPWAGQRHGRGPRGFGGPPFAWGWMGPASRPRPRRGDIRLAVLRLLGERPMHGYQIITELTERSHGAWRPSPGSVYPTLQQLEDEGLVSGAEQEGRRTFTLTPAGREELARLSEDRRAPWEEMAESVEEDSGGLRGLALEVLAASMQVSMVGDGTQVDKAEHQLRRTRRALYRLLAEDDESEEAEQ